jgi:hypothetical protein
MSEAYLPQDTTRECLIHFGQGCDVKSAESTFGLIPKNAAWA